MITRPKNRYLLVEASTPLDTSDHGIANAILDSLAVELGAVGYVRANPKIVHSVGGGVFVLRVNRGYEGDLVLALSFVKRVGAQRLGFYTIKTSGTIRALISSYRKAAQS